MLSFCCVSIRHTDNHSDCVRLLLASHALKITYQMYICIKLVLDVIVLFVCRPISLVGYSAESYVLLYCVYIRPILSALIKSLLVVISGTRPYTRS